MHKPLTEDLLRSSDTDPVADGEEIVLLDERGHLTPEASAFPGELGVYQRAVVDRHLELCDLCANQVTSLARARQRLVNQQPRLLIPAGLGRLGRQVALRSLPLAEAALQQQRTAAAAGTPKKTKGRRWAIPPALLIVLLMGMAATLVVAAMALALSGCKKNEPDAGPLKVTLSQPTELTRVAGLATAAAMARDGRLAVGAEDGRIRVLPADLNDEPKLLAGHPGEAVSALAFAGEDRLVSAAGKGAMVWALSSLKPGNQLKGPQPITALTVEPAGKIAYFGTDQGHVMRWDLSVSKATPVVRFPCGATGVPPARMQLPPAKRCRFGTYHQTPDGQHACLYPVSVLLSRGGHLFRACREGTLASRDMSGEKTAWFTAGHLSLITSMPPDLLLLGQVEGDLNIYQPADNKLVRVLDAPAKKTLAGAATDKLLAVAQEGVLLIWSRPGKVPAARVQTPPGVIWIHLTDTRLRYLVRDGRVISHGITTSKRQ